MKVITKRTSSLLRGIAGGASLLTLLCTSGNAKAQAGAALNFDGVDDVVNLGTSISSTLSTLNKITVEAWVRPTSSTGNGPIVSNYSYPTSNQMQFMLRRNGGASYTWWIGNGNGNNYIAVASAVAPTLNVWQQVVGVWDGTVSSIYVNGVLSGTASVTYAAFGVTSNSVAIGYESAGGGEKFTGDIDEVRIWTRALCPAEFQNNMIAELTPGQANLLAYYKFNQGTAGGNNAGINTLTDASGNSITGTLNNFALTGATSNWVTPGGVTSGSLAPVYYGGSVTVNSGSINPGQIFTMTPSGAPSYTFSSGSSTVAPNFLSTYTVYGYVGGCLNKAISTVSVSANSINFDGVNDNASSALPLQIHFPIHRSSQ